MERIGRKREEKRKKKGGKMKGRRRKGREGKRMNDLQILHGFACAVLVGEIDEGAKFFWNAFDTLHLTISVQVGVID